MVKSCNIGHSMIRKLGLLLVATLVLGVAVWIYQARHPTQRAILVSKLDQVVRVTHEPIVDCASLAAQKPFVILALGQSNAANQGELVRTSSAPILLLADNKCALANDPLPGSTGRGASIWSRLPNYLLVAGLSQPLVLSVMGIDGTSISDWTDDQSPLRQRLTDRINSMKAQELMPTLILWQQGEADARSGTSNQAYEVGLDKLAVIVAQAGSDAPIVLAYSTFFCRFEVNDEIRKAISSKFAQNGRFKVGPDTDMLKDASFRFNGCHFSASGLNYAAQLWAKSIADLSQVR